MDIYLDNLASILALKDFFNFNSPFLRMSIGLEAIESDVFERNFLFICCVEVPRDS